MNILISAYASEPGAGSEYGVGWNVPVTLATRHKHLNVYVLTRSRCREKIEAALAQLALPNLHFLFYDIPRWLTVRNEMQSRWGEQINYLVWQLLVRRYVRHKHKELHFDVFHHLTFNQYRTPSPGFWLDIPFVMGAIGGAETIAPAFWQDLEPHTRKKEEIRLAGKDLRLFRWLCTRRKNKKLILCSSGENLRRLTPYAAGSELRLMPAIGFSKADFPTPSATTAQATEKPFEMLYAGKAWDWKGIHIFLKAVRQGLLDRSLTDFRIRLVGIRFEEEQRRVMGWADELGLKEHVELTPFIERSRLLAMEAGCSLSVYPAFRDSGSMSVLEACALGCPTICFAAGGQDIFPDDILLKVPVADTYEATLAAFADKLQWAYSHRDEAAAMGRRSQEWVAQHLTWEQKADTLAQVFASQTTPPHKTNNM